MKHDPKVCLDDAIMACKNIKKFIADIDRDEFINDIKTQAAVERQFEILGESFNRIKNIDQKLLDKIDSWREIIGFRNIIAHGYDVIEYELVWETIKDDIPILLRQLKDISKNI